MIWCVTPLLLAVGSEQAKSESVGAATLAIVAAAIGYVIKSLYEALKGQRYEVRARLAKLRRLESLLSSQLALYQIQSTLRDKLFQQLQTKNKITGSYKGETYEDIFSRTYATFDAEELELHAVIRGYTETGLAQINASIRAWLDADTDFKTGAIASSQRELLATQLRTLDVHLAMWEAKYAFWIPDHSEHALVYLQDER